MLTTTDGSGGVVYTVLGRKKLFTVQKFFDQSNDSFHCIFVFVVKLHGQSFSRFYFQTTLSIL